MSVTNALSIELAGLSLDSPVFNASGTFNAGTFNQLFPLKGTLGMVVTKTVTAEPWKGNPQPRTHELPGIGMLNSIGLQNPGLEYCLNTEIPELRRLGMAVMLSLSANSVEDFVKLIDRVNAHESGQHVAAIELNLSCPNVAKGGVHFGRSEEAVYEVLKAVTQCYRKPVFTKLTPNVEDIVSIGQAAVDGGTSGLTAINTVLGVAIDWKRRQPVMPRISAGYSGPGIKPIALHAVWSLYQVFPGIPIIGVGGIASAEDILEFLMAGASAVQVGTSCFRDPLIFADVIKKLRDYCEAEGLSQLSDIRGCAHKTKLLVK